MFKRYPILLDRSFPIKVSKIMIESTNSNTQEANIFKSNCPDCDAEIEIPSDTEIGEIVSCSGCGLELEVKAVKDGCVDLQELTLEGEDWGE
jgi:alpha-aminoadipate carrier protein LysW